MSAKAIDPMTGEDVELHDLECVTCSQPMDGHRCPGASFTVTTGAAPTAARSGAGVPRGKKSDKPKCGHCNGVMHYNLGGGFEDLQCTWRQYLTAHGIVTDPLARLPKMVPGSNDLTAYNAWVAITLPSYGTMITAAVPTGGSYAAKRAVEAPPTEKKVRTPKKGLEATVAAVTPVVPAVSGEDVLDLDAAEIVTDTPPQEEAPPEAPSSTSAERRRLAGSARRKAALLERRAAVR